MAAVGRATAARLRLAWRVVRAAELLALAVLLSRSFPRLPCAAAAASSVLRLAASLLLHPRSIFLFANAIVLVLLALSRRDLPSSSSTPSSSSSNHDPHDLFFPFSAPPSTTEETAPAAEEDAVFVDKQAVHVTVRAPRRSRSEKVGGEKPAPPAELQLRRSESDNACRQLSIPAAAPEEWGLEDEEFRKAVEEFIAKQQTRFHREESLVLVAVAGDRQISCGCSEVSERASSVTVV